MSPSRPVISLIAAMSENRVIGRAGRLPWHISADLKHFQRLTTGHAIVMGRKTFETLDGPLPNRRNMVLSRRPDYACGGVGGSASGGVEVFATLEAALAAVEPRGDEVFIVGGGEIYRAALPLADRVYLTIVHAEYEGDTFFPEIPADAFVETERERHEGSPAFSFVRYERMPGARA